MRFVYMLFALVIFLFLLSNSIYSESTSPDTQPISIAIVMAGTLAGGDGK